MKFDLPTPMLRQDAVILTRSDPAVGAEGTPINDRIVIPSVTRGTWRALAPQEQLMAAQRGTVANAQCSFDLRCDVRAGDWVTVMGDTYEVVQLDELRTFKRSVLRVVEQE